jgi:hypothetical protein
MGYENINTYLNNTDHTPHRKALVAHPGDSVAGWEPWLWPLPSVERVSYRILLSGKKTKIESTVSIKCVSLFHHCKVENSCRPTMSHELICTVFHFKTL